MDNDINRISGYRPVDLAAATAPTVIAPNAWNPALQVNELNRQAKVELLAFARDQRYPSSQRLAALKAILNG